MGSGLSGLYCPCEREKKKERLCDLCDIPIKGKPLVCKSKFHNYHLGCYVSVGRCYQCFCIEHLTFL